MNTWQEQLDEAEEGELLLGDAALADLPNGFWSDVARTGGVMDKRNDAGTLVRRLLQHQLGTDW